MSCSKYSFLVLTLGLLVNTSVMANMFTSRICLMTNFDTSIEHEGKFFGLVKNKLDIKKEDCLVEINYKNILDTKWIVDICREPVHIKVKSRGSLEFYKRKGNCSEYNDQYCKSWGELKQILQDHGLIFAKGERESLQSSHGKTYCTYLLMNKYLGEGVLFSKYKQTPDIFTEVKPDVKKEVIKTPKVEEVKEEVAPKLEAQDKKEETSSNQARF